MNNATSPADTMQILKCKGGADVLAALPRLAGFQVENSLAVLCFRGASAQGSIRIDFPAVGMKLEDWLQETLNLVSFCDRIALAFITNDSTLNEASPYWLIAKLLQNMLEQSGIELAELLIQGEHQWVSLLAAEPTLMDVAEIEASPFYVAPQTLPTVEEWRAARADNTGSPEAFERFKLAVMA